MGSFQLFKIRYNSWLVVGVDGVVQRQSAKGLHRCLVSAKPNVTSPRLLSSAITK